LLNEYFIFCIKEKFAVHFFHKSDVLYRFLKSYQQNKGNADLYNQYHYVTNEFPKSLLLSHINTYHRPDVHIHIQNNKLVLSTSTQDMTLYICDKHLRVCCKTLQDAEDLLFSSLRLFNPFLFVTCFSIKKYGWISPIMLSHQAHHEHLLSS